MFKLAFVVSTVFLWWSLGLIADQHDSQTEENFVQQDEAQLKKVPLASEVPVNLYCKDSGVYEFGRLVSELRAKTGFRLTVEDYEDKFWKRNVAEPVSSISMNIKDEMYWEAVINISKATNQPLLHDVGGLSIDYRTRQGEFYDTLLGHTQVGPVMLTVITREEKEAEKYILSCWYIKSECEDTLLRVVDFDLIDYNGNKTSPKLTRTQGYLADWIIEDELVKPFTVRGKLIALVAKDRFDLNIRPGQMLEEESTGYRFNIDPVSEFKEYVSRGYRENIGFRFRIAPPRGKKVFFGAKLTCDIPGRISTNDNVRIQKIFLGQSDKKGDPYGVEQLKEILNQKALFLYSDPLSEIIDPYYDDPMKLRSEADMARRAIPNSAFESTPEGYDVFVYTNKSRMEIDADLRFVFHRYHLLESEFEIKVD